MLRRQVDGEVSRGHVRRHLVRSKAMHSLPDDEKFGDAPCVVVLKRLPIDNLVKHQTACELDKDNR